MLSIFLRRSILLHQLSYWQNRAHRLTQRFRLCYSESIKREKRGAQLHSKNQLAGVEPRTGFGAFVLFGNCPRHAIRRHNGILCGLLLAGRFADPADVASNRKLKVKFTKYNFDPPEKKKGSKRTNHSFTAFFKIVLVLKNAFYFAWCGINVSKNLKIFLKS